MSQHSAQYGLKGLGYRTLLIAIAALLGLFTLFQLLAPMSARAAEMQDRKATLSTSKPSSTGVQIVFSYNLPDTTNNKEGIIYEFCTTPQAPSQAIGSANCTAPGWTISGFTHVAQTGWPSNGTAFAAHSTASDESDCSINTNPTKVICFERDSATTGGGAVTHTVGGIDFNSTIQTVYIRILTYDDRDSDNDSFEAAGQQDIGTVAVAVNRQLTVSGRVAERLTFCVYAQDDVTARPANCAAATTNTTVDMGVIDTSLVQTPVDNSPPSSYGNDKYGSLLANTNAGDGMAITYVADPVVAGATAAGGETHQLYDFRVYGSTVDCSATTTSETDQCFEGANSAGENLASSDERFGMYVPCIENNDGTNSTTSNLVNVPAAYTGTDATVTTVADCENEGGNVKYAWNSTGTPVEIANSTASALKVVDDEIVKLRFGAVAAPTTPTGAYQVIITFIATPQF